MQQNRSTQLHNVKSLTIIINQKFCKELTLNEMDNLVPIPIRHFLDSLSQFWHDQDTPSYQL